MTEFAKAWAFLVVFYGALVLASALGRAPSFGVPLFSSPLTNSVLVLHGLALTISSVTNWFLLRSMTHIESGERIGRTHSRFSLGWPLDARREAHDRLQAWVAAACVVPIGLAFCGVVVSDAWPWLVLAGYVVQLAISSVLFAMLALMYWRWFDAKLPAIACGAYAISQLFYPQAGLVGPNLYYFLALVGVKVFLVLSIATATNRIVLSLDHSRKTPESFEAIAHRLSRSLPRGRWANRAMLVLGATVGVLGATAGYMLVLPHVETNASATVVLVARLLFALITVFGAQVGLYAAKAWSSKTIQWESLCSNELGGILAEAETKKEKGWHHTILRPRGESCSPHARRVVMLHGLLSNSGSCWGLLPAVLIKRGQASEVHLLSYGHTLWSPLQRLPAICEEFANRLRSIAKSDDQQVVVFAHSLGSFVAMRGVLDLNDKAELRTLRRIRHVMCVGAPLAGTLLASLGLPWPWFKALMPKSRFISETLKAYARSFPPAGRIVGEAQPLPSFALAHGRYDPIAPILRPYSLPGVQLELVGDHTSIAAVFNPDSIQAQRYVLQLDAPSRKSLWLSELGTHLLGAREDATGFVFELGQNKDDLDDAWVQYVVKPSWGSRMDDGDQFLDTRTPRMLRDELFKEFVRPPLGSATSQQREQLWSRIKSAYLDSKICRELVRLDFSSDRTLYVFGSGGAGVALVVAEHRRGRRDKEISGPLSDLR